MKSRLGKKEEEGWRVRHAHLVLLSNGPSKGKLLKHRDDRREAVLANSSPPEGVTVTVWGKLWKCKKVLPPAPSLPLSDQPPSVWPSGADFPKEGGK